MVEEIVNFFMTPFRRVDIHQVVATTVDSHDDDIVALNLSQLQAGKLSTGDSITPPYRRSTIKIKQAKGQPTDVVTLKDKGKFYQGTFAKRTNGGMEVSSSDPKTEMLEGRYTESIFGLTVASKEQLAERIRPTLGDNYNRAFYGN